MKLKDAIKTVHGEIGVKRAQKFAEKAHKGQVRKFDKEPYVKHPKRVAAILRKHKDSHEIYKLIQAALLHDTIEDTKYGEKELRKKFGTLVTSLVKELSSDKEDMVEKGGKRKYLAHKTQNMSSWALVIKLADRLDNVSDFKTASPDFIKSYGKQTNYILDELEKNRKLSATQARLVKDIRKKMAEVSK